MKDEEIFLSGKQPTYYVEENEKFLNLLISNCEPILNEIASKFDNFNKINKICESFYAKKYRLPTNKDEVFDKIKEI